MCDGHTECENISGLVFLHKRVQGINLQYAVAAFAQLICEGRMIKVEETFEVLASKLRRRAGSKKVSHVEGGRSAPGQLEVHKTKIVRNIIGLGSTQVGKKKGRSNDCKHILRALLHLPRHESLFLESDLPLKPQCYSHGNSCLRTETPYGRRRPIQKDFLYDADCKGAYFNMMLLHQESL